MSGWTGNPDDELPIIQLGAVPLEERDAAWNLHGIILEMDAYVTDFRAALSLLDFCLARGDEAVKVRDGNALMLYGRWSLIAARDGAMTIFHFAKAMEGARRYTLPLCPTLVALADHTRLRGAEKLMRQHFPYVEKMRHAVAHMAELTRVPDIARKNSISGKYEDAFVSVADSKELIIKGDLRGRAYTSTYEGVVITYDLSQDSVDHLIAIKREFFAGIRAIVKGLRGRPFIPEPRA